MPPVIDVARRFAEAVEVLRAVHDFDDWIGQFWFEPCFAPVAARVAHATFADSDSIVWDEVDGTVFGFLPGRDGCFCIPRDVPIPTFPFGLIGPSRGLGQDIVISAEMREELQTPGG